MTQNNLSPLSRCLQIAAARGRAIRLAREKAGAIVREEQANDESTLAAAMRKAADDCGDDERVQTDPALE